MNERSDGSSDSKLQVRKVRHPRLKVEFTQRKSGDRVHLPDLQFYFLRLLILHEEVS
jgi:hypothetical protein